MPAVIAIASLALLVAGLVYLGLEREGVAGAGMALLRAAGIAALALLLFNPARLTRAPTTPPTVLLDASLSLAAAGGRWREARDTARALAGGAGTVLRFGSRVGPDDTLPPTDGSSRLADALRLAQGRPGPSVVVTDGEIEDAATLEPSWLAATRVVLLPRAARPDAALLEVAMPQQLARGDSLSLDLTIGTFGPLSARQGHVEIALDSRVVARRDLELPPPGGTARRRVVIGPRALTPGLRLLRLRLTTPGDVEPRDDERQRWIHVAAEANVVVLAAPANWESRFLVRELSDIAPGAVRGYALVQAVHWVDMRTLARVSASVVEQAARGANLVIRTGTAPSMGRRGGAEWRWPGTDSTLASLGGDWYVSPGVPASPLAGRLGPVAWDSLPPLVSLVPVVSVDGQWVALSARLARRGATRPLVLGWDSAGARVLAVTGEGLWRWALRGGAAREAYRALLAAGLDWLLGDGAAAGRFRLTASDAVQQGTPVAFHFTGDSVPDSLRVTLRQGPSVRSSTLRFDAQGTALVWLPPGAYRWSLAGGGPASGQFVVEEYSDELPPRAVALRAGWGTASAPLGASYARQRPWLFALVVVALSAEWIWRHRRGLP